MKILSLKLADGSVTLTDAPSPLLEPGFVRVRTLFSAVSPGTEGGKIVTGKQNLLGKARARPDQVKQVIEMARAIGVQNTLQKVRAKLEGAQPLGYSLAGLVTEVGSDVTHVRAGDLVACAGGGYANHADEVVVPRNLVVKVPAGVPADAAAMTTLGAIALQGVRLASPTLGENVVVVGLGVVGLLACQLLRAGGCRVFGADVSAAAVERALQSGSVDLAGRIGEEPVEAMVQDFTRGRGADAVLICAATSSSEPVVFAGRVTRKRGRVIVVGAVGMDLPRENYYEKELQFAVSCSYGPGRYDSAYEEGGRDYPVGFVRWTEGRNLEAVLDMVAVGRLQPLALVSHRFAFDDAARAYQLIAERAEPYAGILLEYPAEPTPPRRVVEIGGTNRVGTGVMGVGCIGAGSYAQSFLLPPLRSQAGVRLTSVFTRSGLSALDVGRRFGFARAVDSAESVLEDPDTAAVVIATRHGQHGSLVLAALERGKHVFVEKPLCLTLEELGRIAALCRRLADEGRLPILQTGFNRRFSPAVRVIRRHFGEESGPLSMVYRVNAGFIPREHWIQDPEVGGGRIIGEVCHFIDTMQAIVDADPTSIYARSVEAADAAQIPEDNVLITVGFADGSIGTIGYVAQGAKTLAKEYLEVHGAGRSALMDNFATVSLYDARKRTKIRCAGKGQTEEVAAFAAAIRDGKPAITFTSQLATTLATLCALQSLRSRLAVRIDLQEISWDLNNV